MQLLRTLSWATRSGLTKKTKKPQTDNNTYSHSNPCVIKLPKNLLGPLEDPKIVWFLHGPPHTCPQEPDAHADVKTEENGEIEMKAKEIKMVKTEEIGIVKAQKLEILKAKDIEIVKTKDIENMKAKDIENMKAKDIEMVKAEEIENMKAKEIEMVKAEDIEIVKAEENEIVKGEDSEFEPVFAEDLESDEGDGLAYEDELDVKIAEPEKGDEPLALVAAPQVTHINNIATQMRLWNKGICISIYLSTLVCKQIKGP